MLKPLGERDFRFLWLGMTISLLGDGMFFVALPIQVFALENTPAAYTSVLLAWTLPFVALLLVGGVMSDRFDRRNLMVASNLIQGTAIAIAGVLSLTGSLELWHLWILAVAYGIGESFFGPAFGAIVPDVVPEDLLVEANSLDNLSRPLSLRILGPALGGAMIAAFGIGEAFLIDAATFVLANIALLMIRTRSTGGGAQDRKKGLEEVAEGFRFVRSQRWLWGTLLSAAIGLLAFYGPWQALVPFVITNKLDGAEGDLAVVLSAGGVGALVASIVIGHRDLPRRFVTGLYVATAAGTLMLVGFGVATALWQAVVASFLMNMFFTTGIITWSTMMHRLVPGSVLGRVSSFDWMVSTSLIPISLMVTGPLARVAGADRVLVGAGLVGAALVVACLFIPGVRDPERNPAGKRSPLPDQEAVSAGSDDVL